jgi:hypothetical protein
VVHARTLNLSDILQAGCGLATIANDEFIVRGAIHASANLRRMRRLLREGNLPSLYGGGATPDLAEIAAMPTAQPQRARRAKRTDEIEGEVERTQLGFEQRLALIGDGPGKHGFHNTILSAVGAWMRAHPDMTVATAMEVALANAIAQAPRDDALHPVGYVMEQIAAPSSVQMMATATKDAAELRQGQAMNQSLDAWIAKAHAEYPGAW